MLSKWFWKYFDPSRKSFLTLRRHRWIAGLLTRIESYSPQAKAAQVRAESAVYDPMLRHPLRHNYSEQTPPKQRLLRMGFDRVRSNEFEYKKNAAKRIRIGKGDAARAGIADWYAKHPECKPKGGEVGGIANPITYPCRDEADSTESLTDMEDTA